MSAVIRNFTIIAAVAIFCLVLLNTSSCNKRAEDKSSSVAGATMLSGNVVDANYFDRIDTPATTSAQPEATGGDEPVSLSVPLLPSTPDNAQDESSAMPEARNTVPSEGKYRMVWAIVTAYCPCYRCCGRGSPGRTSLGKSAWKPGIAADPRAIPYGTKIHISGYGTFRVDDTGGAMRRSWRSRGMLHIDLRMTYHWQARKWGRRKMKIKIYE